MPQFMCCNGLQLIAAARGKLKKGGIVDVEVREVRLQSAAKFSLKKKKRRGSRVCSSGYAATVTS
jgi:hypothetical protein